MEQERSMQEGRKTRGEQIEREWEKEERHKERKEWGQREGEGQAEGEGGEA